MKYYMLLSIIYLRNEKTRRITIWGVHGLL